MASEIKTQEVTMSMYEALVKQKALKGQVDKMELFRLVESKKKYEETAANGAPIEDVKSSIQKGFDKTVALYFNYIALKAAINESNAKTTVMIDGKEYTVANALVRQANIYKEEKMYQRLLENYHAVEADVNKSNKKNLDPDSVAQYVSRTLNGSKTNEDLIKSLQDDYRKRVELEVYDPLNTKEFAESRLEELARFKDAIKFALTESNVKTTIKVEFM